jgi:hypothetical protein
MASIPSDVVSPDVKETAMNKATIFRYLRLVLIPLFVLSLGLAPRPASALDDTTDAYAAFSAEELAQMLAPIALYPDALLAQILMASTYPIEVIEADRWIRANQGLAGDALNGALLELNWDPSVKALCHFPTVLALMSERIGETTNLGNAFLAQEAEVMEMVQRLRSEAHIQGNLNSSPEQKVVVRDRTIIIEPADPAVVYVPYYDPTYVYGTWWYPAYPPSYWGPAGAGLGASIFYWPATYFSVSFGTWSYFDWPRHYIFIDIHRRPRFVRHAHWHFKSAHWVHVPQHRRGVSYHDRFTARRFGQTAPHVSRIRSDSQRFSDRINQGRNSDRRGNGQLRVGQEARRGVNQGRDQIRQDRPRTEHVRQIRERAGREAGPTNLSNRRQAQRPAEASRQIQERTRRGQREQATLESNRQVRTVPAAGQQNNRRIVREPKNSVTFERNPQPRQRVDRAQQIRARQQTTVADRNLQRQLRTEPKPRNGDSRQFTNRANRGSGQSISNERGFSRGEHRSYGSRGESRSGGGRGGRDVGRNSRR